MSATTGDSSERITPGRQISVRQRLLLLRHEFAYAVARDRLPADARVLEVGCGAGYGSAQLAERAAEYVGLDVDAATVAAATRDHASERCRFERYDGVRLPFEAARFDAAVSFQVVEHVADDVAFLAELARVLSDAGVLVLSTPNRLTRVEPGRRPWNRYHVREYAPDELRDRLAERLRSIRRVAAIDVFGLRDRIPEWGRQAVARWVEGRAPAADTAVGRFDLSDFRCATDALDRSLDLIAVCRRPVRRDR